jgi:hypothetical protein
VPAAEVINVTRDVVIEGPGHIHIHSSSPQRIEYVQLRNMGIVLPGQHWDGVTSGRYAIHIHHGGDGTRGTVIRGVASIDAGGRVFVPHGSHGITLVDNVAVNSMAEGLWWDAERDERGATDRSDDIVVDRLAVLGANTPRSITGTSSKADAITLAGGERISITNSVAAGASRRGFDWPSQADNFGGAFWTFSGNVAHNNRTTGVRLWNNNESPHVTSDYISYRHGSFGLENGAYANANVYENILLVEDVLFAQASGRGLQQTSGRPQTFRNVEAPLLRIGHLRVIERTMYQYYDNVTFGRVLVDGNQRQRWVAKFHNSNVTPAMIEWPNPMLDALEGSEVELHHRDGRTWTVRVVDGQVVVQ